MGLPEPIDEPPDEAAPAPRGEGRADWLCGAEEGLEAEMQRRDAHATPAPKLFRPGADAAAEPPPSAPPARRDDGDAPALRLVLPSSSETPAPRLTRPSAPDEPGGSSPGSPPPGIPLSSKRAPAPAVQPEEPSGFSHGPAMLWEPGANSVPVLPRDTAPPAASPPRAAQPVPPASALDFPMDDAEERARASAEAAASAAAAAERAAQPHAVVTPDAFDLRNAPVPWWMQVPQMLREDRRAQVLAGLVGVLLLALLFWPRAEKSLSIGSLRRDAARYDGQSVRVSGRIGEIFEVGGGYAFYLHQGRDTLVVFTRSRSPRRGEGVSVVGMISTGYLNGQAGTALFETPKP